MGTELRNNHVNQIGEAFSRSQNQPEQRYNLPVARFSPGGVYSLPHYFHQKVWNQHTYLKNFNALDGTPDQ